MPAPIRLQLVIDPSRGQADAAVDQTARGIESRMQTAVNGLNAQFERLDRIGARGRFFDHFVRGAERGNSALASFGNSLIRISAGLYAAERLGRIFRTAFIDPVVGFNRAIVTATENSRKFEYAISGVAGGLARARQINADLVRQSRFVPQSVEDLRESARALGATPALAARLGLGDARASAAEVARFSSVTGRLAQIDPAQGVSGGIIGLREAFEGDLQSLRRRFGLSPQTLARLGNTTVAELRRDPARTLDAVERFADIFLPEESYQRTQQLLSVRVQKLKDAAEFALVRIGDSGVFDSTSKRLAGLSDQLFEYLDSADFDRQARRISDRLDRVIGNVARSGEKLLNSLTGKPNDLSSVAGTVDAIGNIVDRVAGITDQFPDLASKIGPAISDLTSRIGQFTDAVIDIADAARDPGGYVQGIADRSAANRTGRSANEATRNALRRAGIDPGAIGVQYYRPGTNADDVYAELRRGGTGFLGASRAGIAELLREATGAAVPATEELSFARLPVEQRLVAQRLYQGIRDSGQVDEKLFVQLRALVTGSKYSSINNTPAPRGDESTTESLVRKLIRAEYQAPGFESLLQAARAGSSGISALADRQQSPFERLEAAGSVFGDIRLGKNESITFKELLGRVDSQFRDARDVLDRAIDEGRRQLVYGGDDPELRQGVSELSQQRDRLITNYRAAINAITDEKLESVRDFSAALGATLGDLPPEARAEIQRSIIDGTTSVAEQFVQILGEPVGGRRKNFGIESLPIEQQRKRLAELGASITGSIKGAGEYGDVLSLPPTASAEDIRRLRALTPEQVNRRLLEVSQGELSREAQGLLERASAVYRGNPSEVSLGNLRAAQVEVAELGARVRELEYQLDPTRQAFEDFAGAVRDSIQGGISDSIYTAITDFENLGDAAKNVANSIIRAFADMQAKLITNALFGNTGLVPGQGPGGIGPGILGGLLGSALGGLFGGGSSAGTFGAGSTSTTFRTGSSVGGNVILNANGNILRGGYTPIAAFANGGVVSQPTVGIVGEGRHNEAIVPLPNGREIPVEMRGGRDVGPVVFVVDSPEEAFRRGFRGGKDMIVDLVQREARYGTVGKMIKRGG